MQFLMHTHSSRRRHHMDAQEREKPARLRRRIHLCVFDFPEPTHKHTKKDHTKYFQPVFPLKDMIHSLLSQYMWERIYVLPIVHREDPVWCRHGTHRTIRLPLNERPSLVSDKHPYCAWLPDNIRDPTPHPSHFIIAGRFCKTLIR